LAPTARGSPPEDPDAVGRMAPRHVSANAARASGTLSVGPTNTMGRHPSELGMACRGLKLPEGRDGDEPANNVARLMQLCEEHTRGL
jgi:hypothetical protein